MLISQGWRRTGPFLAQTGWCGKEGKGRGGPPRMSPPSFLDRRLPPIAGCTLGVQRRSRAGGSLMQHTPTHDAGCHAAGSVWTSWGVLSWLACLTPVKTHVRPLCSGSLPGCAGNSAGSEPPSDLRGQRGVGGPGERPAAQTVHLCLLPRLQHHPPGEDDASSQSWSACEPRQHLSTPHTAYPLF